MSTAKLKEIITKILPEVDSIITWQEGFDKLHTTPLYIRDAADMEKILWSPLCGQNLAGYLPYLKKKTAVTVKGCDSRAVAQLLQEGLIDRNNVVIIGIPCTGVVDIKKIQAEMNQQPIEEVKVSGSDIIVKTSRGEKTFSLKDICPEKCRTCQYPTPVVYDHLAGNAIQSDKPAEKVYEDIREFEAKPLAERKAYFDKEFEKCIRCYACRNACPMCVCRDNCIAETRDPHWMTARLTLTEKTMFHMIHAVHLAGRCIECGECERACPMDIPVAMLKKKINADMKDLYNYTTGISTEDKPPMYTFKVEEEKIKEHKL